MLRFGIISSIFPDKGTARVKFDGDDVVSAELPILQWKTMKDKYSFSFDVNEHVVCIMDKYAEDGVILGAIYSKDENPAITNKNISGVVYEDGSFFKYDREQKFWDVKIGETILQVKNKDYYLKAGNSEIRARDAGHTVKKGGESLKTIMIDLIDAILEETHPSNSGPTGTPINAATYTAIKNRISTFFEA